MNICRSAFVLLLMAVSGIAVSAQTIQVNKENRTIAITTSDQAEATADVAVISIGFNTYGTAQDTTYSDGSRISNAIIQALQASGVKTDSIESANQSLSEIEDTDKVRWAKGVRFSFTQSWRVSVAAKDAAAVLHVAITSGANDSGGIEWKLASDDAVEAEAAQKALAHAQQIAESMTKGLHAKLGALIYASNQTPPRGLFGMSLNGMSLNTESASMRAPKPNLKPLAISPEKIQKSATVYAVFAIE